jgi:hypothetical protein
VEGLLLLAGGAPLGSSSKKKKFLWPALAEIRVVLPSRGLVGAHALVLGGVGQPASAGNPAAYVIRNKQSRDTPVAMLA